MVKPFTTAIANKFKVLAVNYNLKLLVLFGSRAIGSQKSDSDYDFAFETFDKINDDIDINIFDDIMRILSNEKIDLINLNHDQNLYLINEIFSKGYLLYEFRKGYFHDMKHKAFFDYVDFKKYYDKRSIIIDKKIKLLNN